MRHRRLTLRACAALFWLFGLGQLQASTVLELGFSDVVADAELVFEGRVTAVNSRESGGIIHTWVTFEIVDILKGSWPENTVELSYLGGRLGNREMRVSNMELPRPGETGFYFVESLRESLVHPLVGWDQGRFLIERSQAGERVTTADRQPLQGIDTRPQVRDPNSFSKGAAKGVRVQELRTEEGGLSVEEFKTAVRQVLAQ